VKEPFELEWLGGAAEHHFRRARPEIEELPWGTLEPSRYPTELVERARHLWTENIISEYRAIAAFSALLSAFAKAKVPLDLIGMAGAFIADEAVHVELAARIVMELGGLVPSAVNTEALLSLPARDLSALARASELVVRVSCVAETFSGSMVTSGLRHASHPLTKGAYELIARDESKHLRLEWLYMDWVADQLDDAERGRLSGVAFATLSGLRGTWARTRPLSPAFDVEHTTELGWLGRGRYRARARAVIEHDIVEPLRHYGIDVSGADIDSLFELSD